MADSNNKILERLEKARRYGFRQCLDLIRHRIADAHTVEEIIEVIQNIEAAVEAKQIDELEQELFLI